jgi:uncharacterized protein (UPF0332 family)
MPFDFEDFNFLTTDIENSPTRHKEALYRTNISRLYYSAYHQAQAKWPPYSNNMQYGTSAHIEYRTFLKGINGNPKPQKVANYLRELHELRKRADYDSPQATITLQDYDRAKDLYLDIKNLL